MSKHSNVNPDHYKVAGRGRQGEETVHTRETQRLSQTRRASTSGPAPRHPHPARESREAPESGQEEERAGPSGISNRESAAEEAQERQKLEPIDTGSPPPEDAAGRVGEAPLEDRRDRHTSHKAGSRSIAQKEARARYPDRSMPASRKVAGAFGREPKAPPDEPEEP